MHSCHRVTVPPVWPHWRREILKLGYIANSLWDLFVSNVQILICLYLAVSLAYWIMYFHLTQQLQREKKRKVDKTLL